MKTSMLRDAISIGIFAAFACAAAPAATTEPQDDQERQSSVHESPARREAESSATETPVAQLESMTVTGTRIRGGTTPSPVITIGSENIREEGFADLGEALRSLPQNFGGGQNPGVVGAAGSGNLYNQNATGGSSVNLRGIGADATLTLLNGRRLAYGGFVPSIDINAIPVEAVARVEVVADGASAIYGSDAVAGVANVILKQDFDGLAVGARYGTSAGGGLGTREYHATTGAAWSAGGVIATYKKVDIDPIRADQRSYTSSLAAPFLIYPGSKTDSGLLSGHHLLGDRAQVRLDGLRTKRSFASYNSHPGFYYLDEVETTSSFAAPSVELLFGDWVASLGLAWGEDENITTSTAVDRGTGDSFTALYSCYCNISRTYEASTEGPLLTLPAGMVRLAAGAGRRDIEFANRSLLSGQVEGGEERSRFFYVEANAPLVSPEMEVPGVERLSLTMAGRNERYDSFGSVTTPKLGLMWAPTTAITVKATWGRSFKVPMPSQAYANRLAVLWSAADVGGAGYPPDATVLMAFGGNPDLKPERARTQTVSLAFHPVAVPALEAEVSWFDIDYQDRVIQPLPVYSQALSDPALSDFIDYTATIDDQSRLIEKYSHGFVNYTGAAYDPAKVVAIAHSQFTNAMRQKIRGVDLSASYRMDFGHSRLAFRAAATRLSSTQRNSPQQPSFDLSGTLFYPARFSARVGAILDSGPLTASVFANHVDGVKNRQTGNKTASFSTFEPLRDSRSGSARSA